MALVQNAPTLEQALDDVEARFLYNLPRSELEHTERLFFQIEQAYWFYEDFKADVHSNLPHFSTLKSFATKLFSHSALLSQVSDKFQELFSDFKSYKSKIPVYGVIMLNPKMTKAVLVCDYGSKSWTFPRGKINEKETEFACAVREVFEETGFDASPHCREEDHLVAFNDGKQIKMYVACNVPESTVFEIHTRKEISEVQFHPLDALPKTYAVMPFLEKLKRWINKRRQRNASVQKTPVLAAVKSPSRNNNKENKEKDTATNTSTLSRKHKNNQSASEKSPVLHSSSPNLTALNHVTQPSPSTAKRMKNLFDMRNGDTFEEEQSKGWSVNSMFAANAKITGKNYSYDGNPHQFGASHPRYTNYTANTNAVSSRSVFGTSNSTGSLPNFTSASPTPMTFDEIRNGQYNMAGIASAYSENNIDLPAEDDSFRAWSEQSLRNQSLLRSDQPGRSATSPPPTSVSATGSANGKTTSHATSTKGTTGSNSNGIASGVNARPVEFALPLSAFTFDTTASGYNNKSRHDSFDSTTSKDGTSSVVYSEEVYNAVYSSNYTNGVYNKVIFPVDFKLDRAAVMQAFDRAVRA
uniref:Nudix hydrolase domain-containing protein n=1 Tax=Spumella elongata TaxID=89044 RepID=A0A7S3H3Y3_9STRA|mmetsp:Transcript_33512/g.57439  ORF Transcript_33512/g.57439 Transcript_33512/m.57439 type:complete len:582 (+) Transcript_33512:80-1825(+)